MPCTKVSRHTSLESWQTNKLLYAVRRRLSAQKSRWAQAYAYQVLLQHTSLQPRPLRSSPWAKADTNL